MLFSFFTLHFLKKIDLDNTLLKLAKTYRVNLSSQLFRNIIFQLIDVRCYCMYLDYEPCTIIWSLNIYTLQKI